MEGGSVGALLNKEEFVFGLSLLLANDGGGYNRVVVLLRCTSTFTGKTFFSMLYQRVYVIHIDKL